MERDKGLAIDGRVMEDVDRIMGYIVNNKLSFDIFQFFLLERHFSVGPFFLHYCLSTFFIIFLSHCTL